MPKRTTSLIGSQHRVGDAQQPLVFISHATADRTLARAFEELLLDCSGGALRIFRSSDQFGNSGVEYGSDWYATVTDNLEKAGVVIAILTRRSLDHPWLLYEVGIARGHNAAKTYAVTFDLTPAEIRGPLQHLQTATADEDSLTGLLVQLLAYLLNAAPRMEAVRRQVATFLVSLRTIASDAPAGSVTSSPVDRPVRGPGAAVTIPDLQSAQCLRDRHGLISVESLANDAAEIVASGVTLVSLVTPRHDYFELKLREGCRIRLLLADRNSHAWAAWQDGQQILTPEDFELTLRTLAPLYQTAEQKQIEVRFSPFIMPVSLVIADPTKVTGRMNVELAFTGFSIMDRPHLHLTKLGTPKWFDFFVRRFEYLWNMSAPWSPESR